MVQKMKAAIFVEPDRIVLDEKPIPDVGPLDALIRFKLDQIEEAHDLFANQREGFLNVAISP